MMLYVKNEVPMRTTFAIGDDLLAAAEAAARQRNHTVGQDVSDLAHKSLPEPAASSERNGIPLLPVCNTDAVVTLGIVNALRDGLP